MLAKVHECMVVDVTHQRNDNLTIRMRLEVIRLLQTLSDHPMVIDLSIDCESNRLVLVGQWLRTAVDTDNAQSLVCENLQTCQYQQKDGRDIGSDSLVLLAR